MKRNNRFGQLVTLNPRPVINIVFCWTLLIFTTHSYAQTPDWQINTSDFEFSMAFSSVVVIDGIETKSSEDILAAWVGTELRGVANAFYVSEQDRYYFFPLVYSNSNGEEVSFSYYEKARDTIIDLINIEIFVADQNQGSFTSPYVFSDSLIDTSENGQLEYFSFDGFENTTVVDSTNHKIQISLPENADRTQLIAEFAFVEAQSVTVNALEQVSGLTSNDFTEPVEYIVETSSGNIVWTVEVNQVLAFKDQKENFSLEVYPLPSSGMVNINSSVEIDEILVTNMAGISVFQNSVISPSLDLSHLQAGIYLLKVRSGSEWATQKIVIE